MYIVAHELWYMPHGGLAVDDPAPIAAMAGYSSPPQLSHHGAHTSCKPIRFRSQGQRDNSDRSRDPVRLAALMTAPAALPSLPPS